MKSFFNRNIILISILFLAVLLRFWSLGQNPPSLTWDEVAFGYNAYSLGIDGRDEFGRFLPFDYLESFGDFKPPVYAYLDILPIKFFGLNEFSTRFPSAFFGTITVLVTYFLARELFNRRTTQNSTQNHAERIALLSSFLLAISPWHINLSRAAFEANVATFFLVTGIWLFLQGLKTKKIWLVFSVISFAASLYTFNSSRVVGPLLILALGIGFWKKLLLHKKATIGSICIGVLVLTPLIPFLLSPKASLRFKEVNIFSDPSVIENANQQIKNDNNAWWSNLIHNRRFGFAVSYLYHYLDNLNPQFLFVKGDGNPKFSTQDVGQLYFWELPFLIIGILVLFRNKQGNWWIIPVWLFVGIIPAATARETPHALRIETTLPTFQILIAYGLVYFMSKISSIKYQIAKIQIKYFIFVLCILFLIFNLLYYLHGYYAHYPREYSGEWQYGYKESIAYVKNVEDDYSRIYITEELGRPYIYYLFYTEINPSIFRTNSDITREVLGFVHVNRVGKYYFAKDLDKLEQGQKTLYINVPTRIPQDAFILKRFQLLNGSDALVAYTI